MIDKLTPLVRNAERLVASGYYGRPTEFPASSKFGEALEHHRLFPIIAEVKLGSPSAGRLSPHSPERLLSEYFASGAAAISVLTEPEHFGGSLDALASACGSGAPVLMKDFVVSERQIDAAAGLGASAVLLIQEIFGTAVAEGRRDELIDHAHRRGVEVLLEAGSAGTLEKAIASPADLLGINQRDLFSFAVDTGKAARLLPSVAGRGRPVVVMSGIADRKGVEKARDRGADAVLVGGALASSPEPGKALRSMAVGR